MIASALTDRHAQTGGVSVHTASQNVVVIDGRVLHDVIDQCNTQSGRGMARTARRR